MDRSSGSNLLAVSVILATTLVVFLLAAWVLCRQASVAGTISSSRDHLVK